jgi:hypothetical protein
MLRYFILHSQHRKTYMNSYKQRLFTLSYMTYMFKINTILLLPQASETPTKEKTYVSMW